MLICTFFLATITLLMQGVLFPNFSLFAYAPWLALLALCSPLKRALWLSAFAGFCLDLLSDHPFGIHAMAYAASTALLFRFKKHFLVERPLHLGLFTTLLSAAVTVLQLLLLFLFDRRVPFFGKWAFGDLLGMPLIDGLYALVWFSLPLSLFAKIRRKWVVFWLRKKNPSLT